MVRKPLTPEQEEAKKRLEDVARQQTTDPNAPRPFSSGRQLTSRADPLSDPASEVAEKRETEIKVIRNEVGRITGAEFPDGRTFLGSPTDVKALIEAERARSATPPGAVEASGVARIRQIKDVLREEGEALPAEFEPTAPFKDVFESATVQAIKGGFIKLDKTLGITGNSEIIEQEIRKGELKRQIAKDTDDELIELGFGSFAKRVLLSKAGLVGAGVVGSFFLRPIFNLIEFDRQAKALTQAVPDYRESVNKIVANVDSTAYTPEQGRARLDAVEFEVSRIEEKIRVALSRSPTIRFSGEMPQMIAKLDKLKEELVGARRGIFLAEQTRRFDITEEELIVLLGEIQREGG
tara:strand:+ start:1141 stop:2193 length:1053 start_codon:yes stop_codon:yes gene_type:complete